MVAAANRGSADLVIGGNNNFDLLFLLSLGTVPCRRGDNRTVDDFAIGEIIVVAPCDGRAPFMTTPTPSLYATVAFNGRPRGSTILCRISLHDVVQA